MQRADEPTKSLLQRDYSRRDLILGERIASVRFDRLHTCRHHGIAGNSKGKFVDYDTAQLFSLHIDPLPKGRCTQQHSIRRDAKLLQQRIARRGTLQQQRISDARDQLLMHLPHLAITGEQAESASARDLQDLANFVDRRLGKGRLAWIGHFRRQIQQRLLPIAEMRRHHKLSRML